MRILSLIIMLVMMTIMASAQTSGGEVTRKTSSIKKGIERNVDGVVLGISTKDDVLKHLRSIGKSYDLHEPSSNYAVIISNGKFWFQGVEWQAVMYKLYENKVFVITYVKGVDKDKVNGLIITGASLNKRISNKYKTFQTKAEQRLYQYQDERTFVAIEFGEQYDQLSLGFGDIKVSSFLLGI